MKSLSLLSLATVAFGALSDMKLDGLKLDGFDFDSLDILGGKAAAVKKPWYLGGPLPSKGPFGASIPVHLFLDENLVGASSLKMKSLSLLSLATVAFGALSDMKLDGLKLDGFDFDSLDILGGKAAAVKKPWYLGGPLPSKGPFGASIPVHLFLDEYTNATIIDIDGISLELACLPQETGGSVTALIFNVDTGKEISGLFDVGTQVGSDNAANIGRCGSSTGGDGIENLLQQGLWTFITSGTPGPDDRLQPFSCLWDDVADPAESFEDFGPEVFDLNHFLSKFDNGIQLNAPRESMGFFASNTTADTKGFDALCGVWGFLDIDIPKGVPFSVPALDNSYASKY
uniref:Peptidase A1 domain-containing protein n=1 Tax=Chromera velia CCMP2878 TaxID=1169474 RepID=A0A0G4H886_9ALVE|eukprot:Cvel_25084.t1-p1 / transcript=Cvel_25084.t1 / gene=Cvel_25084 / organism=Chromera_velia_CCMP2878 / gene_product=hypothetical protein / transcript_product=hypothetical protein / location=Cvel_scaffold2795:8416-11221(-) / protein_length=342 / sequence_SO=supercontig / SO=protein_coding / is_pseudo=false